MHNHVSGVLTLNDEITNRLLIVAQQEQSSGCQTATIPKWHLGEGPRIGANWI